MATTPTKEYIDSKSTIDIDDKTSSSADPPIEYSTFALWQRITIIFLVSSVSVLSSLSSALYTPALPKMAGTLGVSISAVNFTITTYLLLQGISPIIGGAIGDSLGRRPLYIAALSIYIGACVGLSITRAYPVLLVLCGLLATGAAPNTAIGAGVIGDLVPVSQRGGYMGLYNAGIGLGDAFGPVIGGAFAQFTGYHGIFFFLLALSGTMLLLLATLLPETLRSIVGNGSIIPPWYLRPSLPWLSSSVRDAQPSTLSSKRRLDLIAPLRLLSQPDVLCCLAFTGVCYMTWQMSMVATSAQYSREYHLNEFAVGLTYISNGAGELVGSLLVGKILDHEYKRQLRREAAGAAYPKQEVMLIERARLYSLQLPIPMFIGSIIAFGWVIHLHTHIAVPIVLAFFIGWSVQSILTTLSTLLVDLFEDQSSTATATFIMTKGLLGAAGSSSIQPLINKVGTGWAFTILGGICILALPTIWAEFYFGRAWRARRTPIDIKNDPFPIANTSSPSTPSLKDKHSSDDHLPPAVFPSDFLPSDSPSHRYGVVDGRVADKRILVSLSNAYSDTPHLTLETLLLSALYVTIVRITGQDGGCVGFKSNARNQPRVLSIPVNPAESPATLHTRIHHLLLSIDHREVSNANGDHDMSPPTAPYQVLLAMLTRLSHQPSTTLLLGCEWQLVCDANGIRARVHYSHDIFNRSSVKMFIGIFSRVLESFSSNPSTPIQRLPLCLSRDVDEIREWNDTYKQALSHSSIPGLFRQTAKGQVDDLAVVNDDRSLSLTFGELDHWSDALAQWLMSKGYGADKETIIGVWQTRSVIFVVSLLGCLKAGCAYMPIEMTLPKERVRHMLKDTCSPLVLASGYLTDFPCNDVVECVDLSSTVMQELLRAGPRPDGPEPPTLNPDRLSHVIFTSGSTGLPKAVMIQHSCLLNFINSAYKPITRGDRTPVMLNIAFDVSSGEIWYPLTLGATLVCYTHTPTSPVDVSHLATFLTQEKITSFSASTAVFKLLVDVGFFEKSLSLLRSVDLVGEAAYLQFIGPVLRARPDLAVYNCYGPSESTIYATIFQVPPNYGRYNIAVGKPMSNIGAYIVDEGLQPVPRGVCGELLLTGASLARGYLNRPDLTAEKFVYLEDGHPFGHHRAYRTGDIVRWTADDELEFLHRKEDGQVKLRGQRLELGEVEQTMKQHPQVASSIAVIIKDQLISYAVLNSDEISGDDERVLDLWEDHFNNEESTYHSLHTGDGGQGFVQWYSMFNGHHIPTNEMLQWLDDTIDQIACTENDQVLEVGVGSGMIALEVAPHVQSFVGTDLSTPSLAFLEGQIRARGLSSTVSLFTAAAHELHVIPKQKFSLIIINSVVQYFPSADYLAQVLTQMVETMGSGGRIFVGDLRGYSLISFHDVERALSALEEDTSTDDVRTTLKRYAEGQTELLVDPGFFFDLKRRLPAIAHIEIKPKLMLAQNELSRYRYNVILHVKARPHLVSTSTWLDCSSPGWTVSDLRMKLRASKQSSLGALHIPVSNLYSVKEVLDRIESSDSTSPPQHVADLRRILAEDSASSFPVAAYIVQIAKEEGWRVALDYTFQRSPNQSFRAIFERISQPNTNTHIVGDFPGVEFHGVAYNTPASATADLSSRLSSIQDFLRERLPVYMVPSRIIVVPELPMTRSGKIDRKLLASPEFLAEHDHTSHTSQKIEGASTETEINVLAIFSRALSRPAETIDIRESLFALGGHSLMATLIVGAIKRELGVSLPMTSFYRSPTVTDIAAIVTAERDLDTTTATPIPMPLHGGGTGLAEATIIANADRPSPTLFMFPETTGFASVYATAFENIHHKVVVFGDEHWGQPILDDDSIQAISSSLVQRVREHQPEGPYYLSGWSFGGYLAFEMARQMEAAGIPVALLMMFDSSVYHEPLQPMRWSDELNHLQTVVDDRSAWLRQFNRVRTLISRYQVLKEAYRGRAVLVKAFRIDKGDEADHPHAGDPSNGWREYLPQLEARSIDASHRMMFDRGNGPKMGAMISEIMKSVQPSLSRSSEEESD